MHTARRSTLATLAASLAVACSSSPPADDDDLCAGAACADASGDAPLDPDPDAGDGSGDAEGSDTSGRDIGDGDADVVEVSPDVAEVTLIDVPVDLDYPPLDFTVSPNNGATFVPLDATIVVQFNQPMNALRFIPENVLITPYRGVAVPRLIDYDPDTYALTVGPRDATDLLRPVTPYTLRLSEYLASITGEELGDAVTIRFSTTGAPGRAFHRELALAYAPTIYQQLEDERLDTFTRIDFDGDLIPANNFENLVGPSAAYVYYDVIETPTHFYVSYMLYYPGSEPRTGVQREHDLVALQVVVQKVEGDPLGRIRAFSTAYHEAFNMWLPPDGAGGDRPTAARGSIAGTLSGVYLEGGRRVSLFVEALRHGVCLPNAGTIAGACAPSDDATAPFDDDARGLVVRPAEEALRPGDGVADDALTYALRSFTESFWALRDRNTGADAFYGGEAEYVPPAGEGFTRPGGGENFPTSLNSSYEGGSFGDLPFLFSTTNDRDTRGAWAVDPAYGLGVTLTLPETTSLEYCFNPYLAIDARGTLEGCTAPTDP